MLKLSTMAIAILVPARVGFDCAEIRELDTCERTRVYMAVTQVSLGAMQVKSDFDEFALSLRRVPLCAAQKAGAFASCRIKFSSPTVV
jgi:hypothetical protein